MAKLGRVAKLLIGQRAFCANAEKCPAQLIMMGIAVGEPVIVDEYLELAFTQRRTVEMREVIDRGPGGVSEVGYLSQFRLLNATHSVWLNL
jgi:hypothetical protein